MRPLVRTILTTAALLPAFVAHQPASAKSDKSISLAPLGVYRTLLSDEGAVEIAAYDRSKMRAFLTFAALPRVEVIDLSNPTNPSRVHHQSHAVGRRSAHATSVAVHNGVVAVAVPQGAEDTAPGKVVFFDAFGNHLSDVTVGALPDMLTFTPERRVRAHRRTRAQPLGRLLVRSGGQRQHHRHDAAAPHR